MHEKNAANLKKSIKCWGISDKLSKSHVGSNFWCTFYRH